MKITPFLKEKIRQEEKLKILIKIQQEEEKLGVIATFPNLWLRRYQALLESAGAVFIGLYLGIMVIIFTYIICVKILHLSII